MQSKQIKEKAKQTMLEKYGVEYGLQVPEFKEKAKQTWKQKYGYDNPNKSPNIRQKITNTLYKNSTQRTSKQQNYLHHLLGGILNYPIKKFSSDICFPEDKIIIEYNGGGHNLCVKSGMLTQEEYDKKEIQRSYIIKREGYKQITIISLKDYLPCDEVLLLMFSQAKNFFNSTPHTWVKYDIDNSKMINSTNKDTNGVFFNFGELRKIKQIT